MPATARLPNGLPAVFTLEPSCKRGAPALADRRRVEDFKAFPKARRLSNRTQYTSYHGAVAYTELRLVNGDVFTVEAPLEEVERRLSDAARSGQSRLAWFT